MVRLNMGFHPQNYWKKIKEEKPQTLTVSRQRTEAAKRQKREIKEVINRSYKNKCEGNNLIIKRSTL